jgi:hypothetical protein
VPAIAGHWLNVDYYNRDGNAVPDKRRLRGRPAGGAYSSVSDGPLEARFWGTAAKLGAKLLAARVNLIEIACVKDVSSYCTLFARSE